MAAAPAWGLHQLQDILQHAAGTVFAPSEPDRNTLLDVAGFPRNRFEVSAESFEHQRWIAGGLEFWEMGVRRETVTSHNRCQFLRHNCLFILPANRGIIAPVADPASQSSQPIPRIRVGPSPGN